MYFKKTKTYLFIGIRESNSFNFQQSNEKMKKVREKMQKMCRLRAYYIVIVCVRSTRVHRSSRMA